ncbi:2441_t:CDS:2 [Paraglomus occultum]|uniref:2441_t:CDS:1 n=1 Tax=Paraglomus occultum TaxID=144539 RepID=A0A9N9DAH2_9GLOM|nr:2441_t:CDS:2 [Paraglomus occultum]
MKKIKNKRSLADLSSNKDERKPQRKRSKSVPPPSSRSEDEDEPYEYEAMEEQQTEDTTTENTITEGGPIESSTNSDSVAHGSNTTTMNPAATNSNLASPNPLQRSQTHATHSLDSYKAPKNTDVYLVPRTPRIPKTPTEKENTRRLIVVLSRASLETFKSRKNNTYQLLNCDDHYAYLDKMGKTFSDARPDITHQCLMQLLDSPLNKAGLLQVYIHTARNVLIEVNPHVRIPRTFKRFCGLMVQLLHKLCITSENNSVKLLRVVKNPVTQYLPIACRKLTLSYDAPTVRLKDYLPTIPPDHSICVAIGAMAHGEDNFADDWVDEKIGISEYSLSAAVACSKFCCALEDLWGIL